MFSSLLPRLFPANRFFQNSIPEVFSPRSSYHVLGIMEILDRTIAVRPSSEVTGIDLGRSQVFLQAQSEGFQLRSHCERVEASLHRLSKLGGHPLHLLNVLPSLFRDKRVRVDVVKHARAAESWSLHRRDGRSRPQVGTAFVVLVSLLVEEVVSRVTHKRLITDIC
jgi:hypothetical protein